MHTHSVTKVISLMAALTLSAVSAFAQTTYRQCRTVGGTMATNLAVVDQSTTLGNATGDLKGAVTAAILSVSPNSDGTVSFRVQHHLVTDAGDAISFAPATAVTQPLSATLFAILSYPVHISGGTGRYAKATGNLTAIGEVDLASGQTIFRYSGKVCLATASE
jgi:hypothetical protein